MNEPAPIRERAPLIALLTDFGLRDIYVGVVKGVLLGVAPGMPLVDITHDIAPQDVEEGAWLLHLAWPSFPEGSVFYCVVDPGVGSARRAIAIQVGAMYFVGPDNGLFTYLKPQASAAAVLDNPRYHRAQVSSTFHGRDIFAPCAAQLALGTPLAALGSSLSPLDLVTLNSPQPFWREQTLVGRIIAIDRYGNLIADFPPDLAARILATPDAILRLGGPDGPTITERASHYAAAKTDGAPFALRDSSGHLAIAARNASAADLLHARRGMLVEVTGL